MGNYREVSIQGPFVLKKQEYMKLKRLVKTTDGHSNVDSKTLKNGKYQIDYVNTDGSHGDFEGIFNKNWHPITGKMKMVYHDKEFPLLKHKTIKANKPTKMR